MMRWGIAGLVGMCVLAVGQDACAQWEQAFRTAADTKIHAFKKDTENTQRFILGIEGGILLSKDHGAGWKRVLTVPANQPVIILQQQGGGPKWWAVTPNVLYRSSDGGQKWEACSRFVDDGSSSLQAFLASDRQLYIGRRDGFAVSADEGISWTDAPELMGRSIYQISEAADHRIWVASDHGVYRSGPNQSWERVYTRLSDADENGDESVGEEEAVSVSDPVYFWFGPDGNSVMITDGSKKFIVDSATGTVRPSGLLLEPVRSRPIVLGSKADRVAISGGRGVGLWDESEQSFEELTAGWPGGVVRALAYDPTGDELAVVTVRGVYKYEHPELNGFLEARVQSGHARAGVVLDQFAQEPGILELQEAAMRYAEVHPDKILTWRRLANRRAWLPTVGVGQDVGIDETIDLDRGGTNEPDRFIQGPPESDRQWSVDLSWNLGDLIWSDDQTSIDNRSKLMVQLRDDLLNQLNHLYYARRRIQIVLLLEGAGNIDKEIDQRLQIDEYTAGIDALTGGYFSRRAPSSDIQLEDRTAIS